MEVTRGSRLRLRAQYVVFVVLLLAACGLLAWLSGRYSVQMDWTAAGRNTLSPASRELLARLDQPIQVKVYARENDLTRKPISELLARYRRHKPDFKVEFVDPETAPDEVRELGISMDGEMRIHYAGRSEPLREYSEQAVTNALQRVGRAGERWIVYLTGHGERDLRGERNYDLGDWGKQIEARGLKVQAINLSETRRIPDNAAALVIAGPQVDLFPGEVELVRSFLDNGGNLLWLSDPGPQRGLEPLAKGLGLEFLPGTIVDPGARLFGVDDPSFVLVTGYATHPVTQGFKLVTLYPKAAGIRPTPPDGWEAKAILNTNPQSWSETGELTGEVQFDRGADPAGPLAVGVALERALDKDTRRQRLLVVGDGDFLSNEYLGNGGNLDLGLNMVNWLSGDDTFIAIPAKTAPDLSLNLSRSATLVIGFGALLGLPLLQLGTGLTIWWRRRQR